LNKTIAEIEDQFSKFRISDALHLVYKLIWDDFCAWYLEAIKPNFGEGLVKKFIRKPLLILRN
jgi:valyl-tRNA synthetase